MAMIGYIILGAIAYGLGIFLYIKILRHKNPKASITSYVLGFFVIMLIVSALIGHFILQHPKIDWMYVVINSIVATVVFYFGLTPDSSKLKLPD